MAKFVESQVFDELNLGFVLDEGQASPNDEFRIFYADRSPWNMVIRALGVPGHGSRMYDNSAMENLMKSIEAMSKFRENQFDLVKAGLASTSEVISVNPVYVKAGIVSPTVSCCVHVIVNVFDRLIVVFLFIFIGMTLVVVLMGLNYARFCDELTCFVFVFLQCVRSLLF